MAVRGEVKEGGVKKNRLFFTYICGREGISRDLRKN